MSSDSALYLRRRAQREIRLVEPNQGGRLRVVLAYPNTYAVGMSNLGMHTLYRLFNDHPDVCCERSFLPDKHEIEEYQRRGTPLMTVESQRPVSDADVIAFSASFENDYVNVVRMLILANLPTRNAERDATHPIVIMGGATVSINPEPVAPFIDLCCVGEGEGLVRPLIESILGQANSKKTGNSCGQLTDSDLPTRAALLQSLAASPGFYVPSLYEPRYDQAETSDYPTFAGLAPQDGAPPYVTKVRAVFEGPETVASTSILTPETEFGDRAMIEVARGCTKGCRYCWVGYNILPFRVHKVDDVLAAAERWLPTTQRVGLVATALLDHPDIEAIASSLRERGLQVFSPSLIISTLREPLLRCVVESGQRSITIAPEAGSDRMRELIMKKITNEEILEKTRMIFRAGVLNLKNYVIIGLPGETEADLQDLVSLCTAMREIMIEESRDRGRIGTITLSVNCLIPKPATPFQWAKQIRPSEYAAKLRWLRRSLAKVPNVVIEAMSPRSAEIQALTSRGDRRVGDLLELWAETGSWRQAVRTWEERGGSVDHFAFRALKPNDPLPWGHLRTGASSAALGNQWNKAVGGNVDAAA
ncbi:MAG: radical SAM protein [Acidobacteriota bacterium]|nr:radical SAM protein [Acidobacteriota bacterium]